MIIKNLKQNNKKYDIVYADPPWKQKKGGYKKARPKSSGSELDYPTLSIDDIKDILSSVSTNDKHNFFIWTIDKYLKECEDMMKDLGYNLHSRIIWNKVTGIPAAFTVRYSHEYLLWFYKKGNILKPHKETEGKYSTVFTEQVSRHSKKPIYTYEMIEDMFRDSEKLELFARNERKGWDSFGNEL